MLIVFPFSGKAQWIGVGASAIYNFQSESFGAGARVNFFPNRRLSIVPQFSYYFSFNKVNEYTVGLGLECKLFKIRSFAFYALAHGGYNRWLSSERSAMTNAQPNNWNLDVGGGITTRHCLRPFLECRYNVKFYETHLQLGLLYVFGCKLQTKGNCPAYR